MIPLRDFHARKSSRTLMLTGNRHDLVARNQLLDRGSSLFRQALRVFNDEFNRASVHATAVVDDLGDDLKAILDLCALHNGSWRRLGDRHPDLDRVSSLDTCNKQNRREGYKAGMQNVSDRCNCHLFSPNRRRFYRSRLLGNMGKLSARWQAERWIITR